MSLSTIIPNRASQKKKEESSQEERDNQDPAGSLSSITHQSSAAIDFINERDTPLAAYCFTKGRSG